MNRTLAARRGAAARLLPAFLLAGLAWALWAAAPAAAAPASADEVALARAYAPVVKLKDQAQACAAGEPYEPIDVDLLMGNDEVALRGPWDTTNIVAVAPTAQRLSRGLFGYHLDFPGDALRPGCTYEQFSKRLADGRPPRPTRAWSPSPASRASSPSSTGSSTSSTTGTTTTRATGR